MVGMTYCVCNTVIENFTGNPIAFSVVFKNILTKVTSLNIPRILRFYITYNCNKMT
jgi:hypothetical protein